MQRSEKKNQKRVWSQEKAKGLPCEIVVEKYIEAELIGCFEMTNTSVPNEEWRKKDY